MGGQGPSDTRESEFSLGRSGSKIAGRACYPLALVGCLCLNVEGHVISPVTEMGFCSGQEYISEPSWVCSPPCSRGTWVGLCPLCPFARVRETLWVEMEKGLRKHSSRERVSSPREAKESENGDWRPWTSGLK